MQDMILKKFLPSFLKVAVEILFITHCFQIQFNGFIAFHLIPIIMYDDYYISSL